jgi:hypothetical protein
MFMALGARGETRKRNEEEQRGVETGKQKKNPGANGRPHLGFIG